MSILLQKKNVGDYSYMSSPNIYYRAIITTTRCRCIYGRMLEGVHKGWHKKEG